MWSLLAFKIQFSKQSSWTMQLDRNFEPVKFLRSQLARTDRSIGGGTAVSASRQQCARSKAIVSKPSYRKLTHRL